MCSVADEDNPAAMPGRRDDSPGRRPRVGKRRITDLSPDLGDDAPKPARFADQSGPVLPARCAALRLGVLQNMYIESDRWA